MFKMVNPLEHVELCIPVERRVNVIVSSIPMRKT